VVEHRYGDVTLKIELADPLAAGWYDHDWEPLPELAIVRRHRLRPGARVFDIGSHQGIVGLILGHAVGPAGQVVVVEPNPHNLAMCGRNADLNGMGWVVPCHAAVADRDGTLRINCGLNGQAAELSDYAGVIEVPAVTVDALTTRYGPPDVVMLDVEGFECRALAAAGRTLAAGVDWCVEVHVGCGLEAAGGSADQVLGYFPADRYDRYVHSEGDVDAVPLAAAPPDKLRARFFLTTVARDQSAAGR
jgi:FkbM family methyltransferase